MDLLSLPARLLHGNEVLNLAPIDLHGYTDGFGKWYAPHNRYPPRVLSEAMMHLEYGIEI